MTQAERSKNWALANKERLRELNRLWYQRNKEQVRENARRRRLADPEKWSRQKRASSRKLYRADPQKHLAYNRLFFERHPERRVEIERKCKYGVTPEEFNAKLIAQDGRCEICNDPLMDAHLDHDHKTKKIRDILCSFCNRGIGMFKEDPTRLVNALQYLRKHKE